MITLGAGDGGTDGGMARALSATPYPTSIAGTVAVPFDGSLDFETGSYNQLAVGEFPPSAWGPTFKAQLLLARFASTKWFDPKIAPLPNAPSLADEIRQLIGDVHLRNARLPEIFAQADDFSPYWANMLMVTPGSRPKTWLMITTMMLIGTLVSMKYKDLHKQPRPAQVYPALMPVIQTPGHPSFPSGHALQCDLIADCMARAVPAFKQPARALAERIARNREIARVHFPRDRQASRAIATHLKQVLYDDDPARPGIIDELVAGIRQEYPDIGQLPPPNPQNPVPETA